MYFLRVLVYTRVMCSICGPLIVFYLLFYTIIYYPRSMLTYRIFFNTIIIAENKVLCYNILLLKLNTKFINIYIYMYFKKITIKLASIYSTNLTFDESIICMRTYVHIFVELLIVYLVIIIINRVRSLIKFKLFFWKHLHFFAFSIRICNSLSPCV